MKENGIKVWETKTNLKKIRIWAQAGMTNEQISEKIGIDRATLYRWMKKSPCILNALKMGKEVADDIVEKSLFNSALNGSVQAQIFWLKNRRPDEWRDINEINQKVDAKINPVTTLTDQELKKIIAKKCGDNNEEKK